MPDEIKAIEAELHEAECALAATYEALRTHGRQGITWAFLKADGERVRSLRRKLQSLGSAEHG